jgi:hypothetical protein
MSAESEMTVLVEESWMTGRVYSGRPPPNVPVAFAPRRVTEGLDVGVFDTVLYGMPL